MYLRNEFSKGLNCTLARLNYQKRITQGSQTTLIADVNKFNIWNVHGIMNTSGLLQSKLRPRGFKLTLEETRSIHDAMNIPKNEFITYIFTFYHS